jgi:uncharacterized membrane protein (DUF2068 family)
LHQDAAAVLEHWINAVRVDPQNRYVHALLERAALLDDRRLEQLGIGTFVYSTLLLTEGVGLWLALRWAAYLTVTATSSLIPLEVYELANSITPAKTGLFMFNVCVVWYLIVSLRRDRRRIGRRRWKKRLKEEPAMDAPIREPGEFDRS